MIDEPARDVDRAIGAKHQTAAGAFGAPEIGGEAGGGPHGCRVRRHDPGWGHKEIARCRFMDIARQEPSDLDLYGLVARVGEVDLGAPKVARTSLEVEGKNGQNKLSSCQRQRGEDEQHR